MIVDDDESLRAHLARAIEARGMRVIQAADGEKALAAAALEAPDLAVIDLRMPGMDGLELLRQLKAQCPHTQAVVLTGYGSIANAVTAVQAGAVNYVTKPASASEIMAAFDLDFSDCGDDDLDAPSLAEVEWNHIQRVLEECEGNMSKTSRILGIPRQTLYRKLKKRAP